MKRLVLGALLALATACSDGRGELAAPPSVPVEEARGAVVYVAIGSDETDGGTLDDDDRLRSAWPQVLFRTALPRRTVFYNAASELSTVEDAIDEQLPDALEVQPTLATVWLGRDDAALETPIEDYEGDLGAMITTLRRDGQTRVLVAVGGPVVDGAADLQPYDEAAERVAEATGAEVVDLSGVPRLDVAGNRAVADAFAERIGDVR